MVKLLVGLLKGAAIGGAVGYGAFELANATGFSNGWLTYGLIGALVGLFVGKPLWRLLREKDTTNIIALIKAAFGFGVGCGLYAIVAKAWAPDPNLLGEVNGNPLIYWQPVLGAVIGGLYGGFVELDDSIGDDGAKKKPEPKQLDK